MKFVHCEMIRDFLLLSQVNTYGVEPLKIQNHTECECVYKNRASSQNRLQYPWPFPTPATTTKAPLCKCPSHFEAETDLEEGICGCVCKEGNADCLQRHEGREGFTMSDQRFEENMFHIIIHINIHLYHSFTGAS